MAKNPFPSFNFYTSDWLSSEARAMMTAEQRGIYIDLLALAWQSDPPCSLPSEDTALAQLAGMGPQWWADNGPVLRKWFTQRRGRLWNTKLVFTFEKARALREAKIVGGKSGGAKRAEQLREQVRHSLGLVKAELEQTVSKTKALLTLSTSTSTTTKEEETLQTDKLSASTKINGKETSLIWEAYSTSYQERYRANPVRNAKVNSQIKQFAHRVPVNEGPAIASFYVHHNGARYVASGHSTGLLLLDAEKLHTEWVTGNRINATTARRNEKSEANPFLTLVAEERHDDHRRLGSDR